DQRKFFELHLAADFQVQLLIYPFLGLTEKYCCVWDLLALSLVFVLQYLSFNIPQPNNSLFLVMVDHGDFG
ncbi:MAG: hypothetical protein V7K21_07050, partial [Nostoc sp.]|uniref:hypothetical protein n=1 Tax=Nostoc sp. TaxID=1180 RepID=UPI002FFD3ADA